MTMKVFLVGLLIFLLCMQGCAGPSRVSSGEIQFGRSAFDLPMEILTNNSLLKVKRFRAKKGQEVRCYGTDSGRGHRFETVDVSREGYPIRHYELEEDTGSLRAMRFSCVQGVIVREAVHGRSDARIVVQKRKVLRRAAFQSVRTYLVGVLNQRYEEIKRLDFQKVHPELSNDGMVFPQDVFSKQEQISWSNDYLETWGRRSDYLDTKGKWYLAIFQLPWKPGNYSGRPLIVCVWDIAKQDCVRIVVTGNLEWLE